MIRTLRSLRGSCEGRYNSVGGIPLVVAANEPLANQRKSCELAPFRKSIAM
jgi:hypothetical protein